MGGPSSLDAFAPLTSPQADRIAALAVRVGQMTADCAAAIFPVPLAADTRRRFEAETVAAIAEVLDEFGHLTPANRVRFQDGAVAAMSFRLAQHEAGASS